MAILDIEQGKVEGSKGITKVIHSSAEHLIMDTIQNNQYQFPEASTVRELVSNAVDSQSEKEKVLKILLGEAKIEDYYIERSDIKYKDSNYNPAYYKLDCLDPIRNNVEIHYYEGTGGGWCDKFIVKDYGVGLGDDRLYGYFNLGYSTKRNTTKALGGFGYGAKASLSLRNDYYDMNSVHNNRYFSFRCYSYKVESLIGRFNDDGTENKFIVFNDKDGNEISKVYYEDTSSKNYTEIIVPCKTFHRTKFNESIKSQLLYFDNVIFTYHYQNGVTENRNFKADILYSSKNIIVSTQNQYSKPHIVIVKDQDQPAGVCYGYVKFEELEMQDLFSHLGFKCPMRQVIVDENGVETVVVEGVEVTPSRESVVWSEHTRNYLQYIINNAIKEAEEHIQKQLTQTDFISWLYTVSQIKNNPIDKIIRDISKIIDISQISPKYSLDESIQFNDDPFKMLLGFSFNIVKTESFYSKKASTYKTALKRVPLFKWAEFKSKVYLKDYSTNNNLRKDSYIISNERNFITIQPLTDDEIFAKFFDKDGKELTKYCKNMVDYNRIKEQRDKVWKLLNDSKSIIHYDKVDIPASFVTPNYSEGETIMFTDENGNIQSKTDVIEAEEVKDPYEGMTPAEIRKLESKILVHVANFNTTSSGNLNIKDRIRFSKHEIKGSDFVNDGNIFYGTGDDDELLILASLIQTNKDISSYSYSDNELKNSVFTNDCKICKVSSTLSKKYLKNHKHIDQFFGLKPIYTNKDTEIKMSNSLVDWNTCNIIGKDFFKFEFLEGYDKVNPEIYSLYTELKTYYHANYKNIGDRSHDYRIKEDTYNNFIKYCDNVTELQLFIRDIDDAEQIAEKAKELFGTSTIKQVTGLNLDMYDKYQALLTYCEPLYNLFNHVDFLIQKRHYSYGNVSGDAYNMINEIIVSKGLADFDVSSFLSKEEEIESEIKEEEEVQEVLEKF